MIPINSFDPMTLVLLAAANPAVIAVAFLMGRKADEWQKLPVAAFAAALAGFILYWIGGQVGVFAIHAIGGEAALLLLGCVFGLAWAALGYWLRPR
jgi:cation transporter-like permease